MLSHAQADATIRRQHDLLQAAARRRLIEQAPSQGERVFRLTRVRRGMWQVVVATGAILPGVPSRRWANSRAGAMADGAVIGR